MISDWISTLEKHLRDPVYAGRPRQIVRRLWYWIAQPSGNVEAELPWGTSLKVMGHESNGRTILHRGVDQLTVAETCIRLMESGGIGVDVGANYGQMASALIHGAKQRGTVYAFEPHPFLFEYLRCNLDPHPTAMLVNKALSEKAGATALHVPKTWKKHAGTSSLESGFKKDTRAIEVTAARLDDEVEGPIQVLKVDVEGHELSVLRGADHLLSNRRITHIIFEDHNYRQSKVATALVKHGYDIYSVDASVRGPRLVEPNHKAWNFIATLDPAGVRNKFASSGWKALGEK